MPLHDPPPARPVRGAPGGWHDWWDRSDDDVATVRARLDAAERQLLARARELGRPWRAEIAENRRQHAREQLRRTETRTATPLADDARGTGPNNASDVSSGEARGPRYP